MNITGAVPWYGAKRGRVIRPRIIAELGPHRSYWEIFCGSMAVLFGKPVCSLETVNDLHGDLINLAQVMRHPTLGAMLYRRLRRVLFHEDVLQEAIAALSLPMPGPLGDQARLQRAFWFFVHSWFVRNGYCGTVTTDPGSFAVRFTHSGGSPSRRWTSAVSSIPAMRKRLRQVVILRRDAFELLGDIADRDGVAIYADPPYLVKSCRYVHDFSGDGSPPGLLGTSADDHCRLAESLGRFKRARVVVSYYAHEHLTTLYPPGPWTHIDASVTKGLPNAGDSDGDDPAPTKAPEVLIVNGPAFG